MNPEVVEFQSSTAEERKCPWAWIQAMSSTRNWSNGAWLLPLRDGLTLLNKMLLAEMPGNELPKDMVSTNQTTALFFIEIVSICSPGCPGAYSLPALPPKHWDMCAPPCLPPDTILLLCRAMGLRDSPNRSSTLYSLHAPRTMP